MIKKSDISFIEAETKPDTELSPFESTEAYLEALKQILLLSLLRYLRRYEHRLLNDEAALSGRQASLGELLFLTGLSKRKRGEAWLTENGCPNLSELNESLKRLSLRFEARLEETKAAGVSEYLTLETLAHIFALSKKETQLLYWVAAAQFDNDIARLYAWLNRVQEGPYPLSFYADILAENEEDALALRALLAPQKALRLCALIELGERADFGAHTPLFSAPIFVPERIVDFLLDEPWQGHLKQAKLWELNDLASPLVLPKAFKEDFERHFQQDMPRIGLFGSTGFGRRRYLAQRAARDGLRLLECDLSQLPATENKSIPWRVLSEVFREARLSEAALLFRCDAVNESLQETLLSLQADFHRWLSQFEGPLCLTARNPEAWMRTLFGNFAELHCPLPSRERQSKLWQRALSAHLSGEALERCVRYLSNSYALTPGEMEACILQTQARLAGAPLSGPALLELLRQQRGRALEGFAELRPCTKGLEDVVLKEEARETLLQILNFARYSDYVLEHWGLSQFNAATGLSVLFAGPPGTGKTFTAGVIAHELKRALYVIDLSRVVDKYIGETEKRLAQIFDHAQESQAILLFDEADSLFAKRSAVKSSNDRYANLEVNYLLQRLERYRGLSILTTNLADSLDEALARRLRFKIVFPMPDIEERKELWNKLLPQAARSQNLDFSSLAEDYIMSGGHIQNAIFRACIQAASQKRRVTLDDLHDAAIDEYKNMGHIVKEI